MNGPRIIPKREQYLAVTGASEVVLGLSYSTPTPSRSSSLEWLTTLGLRPEWVGVGIAVVGVVVLLAALVDLLRRDLRVQRAAWAVAVAPTLALTCLWLWTGAADLLDPQIARGWSPWASACVYGSMSALIMIVSDWPDPIDPDSLAREIDTDGGRG